MKFFAFRDRLRWRAIGLSRRMLGSRVARAEWNALSAWSGLVHQAYQATPLQPNLCSDLWHQGNFSDLHSKKISSLPTDERENPPRIITDMIYS